MTRTAPSGRLRFQLAMALAASAAISGAHRVHAHAGPQVRNVQADMSARVLLSNRGLIFGGEGGGWSLMCNEALGINTSEIPDLVILANGRVIVATTKGLLATDDRGCNWQGVAPYGTTNTTSLVQHPIEHDRLFVATFAPGETGMSVSEDAGKTWTRRLLLTDTDYLRFVRIAPSKPEQMYARNLSFAMGGKFHYEVLRSANAGKDWERSSVTLEDGESDLVLLEVSTTDPNLLIGMAESSDPIARRERLLVSHDGGKTFVSPISLRVISSVAFSADGKTLWVAADEGLFRSTDNAEHFERVSEAEYLSCVQVRGDELLVCGFYRGIPAGLQGVGKSSDGGKTFDAYMQLNDVTQPIQCDDAAMTAVTCKPLWKDWQREILGILDPQDAGTPDAGSDSGLTTAPTQPDAAADGGSDAGWPARHDAGHDAGHGVAHSRHVKACGCRTLGVSETGNTSAALASMSLLLSWTWRRRRRGV